MLLPTLFSYMYLVQKVGMLFLLFCDLLFQQYGINISQVTYNSLPKHIVSRLYCILLYVQTLLAVSFVLFLVVIKTVMDILINLFIFPLLYAPYRVLQVKSLYKWKYKLEYLYVLPNYSPEQLHQLIFPASVFKNIHLPLLTLGVDIF